MSYKPTKTTQNSKPKEHNDVGYFKLDCSGRMHFWLQSPEQQKQQKELMDEQTNIWEAMEQGLKPEDLENYMGWVDIDVIRNMKAEESVMLQDGKGKAPVRLDKNVSRSSFKPFFILKIAGLSIGFPAYTRLINNDFGWIQPDIKKKKKD